MMWLWDLVGWICCGAKIGEFRGIPVHKIRLWMPGYSAAFGTRIGIASKHLHRQPGVNDPNLRVVSSRLLEHELKHIEDQRRYGFRFLWVYACDYVENFLFRPGTRFRFKAAYEAVRWETRATHHARGLYPDARSIKWVQFRV